MFSQIPVEITMVKYLMVKFIVFPLKMVDLSMEIPSGYLT